MTALRAGLRRMIDAFLGDEGSTQGAVYAGMVLYAIGFAIADWLPAAFLVPATILTFTGLVPALTKLRRGA